MKKVLPIIIVAIVLVVLGFVIFSGSDNNENNNSSANQPASSDTIQSQANEAEQEAEEPASNTFTTDEVAMHSSNSDCWTIIEGSVYDLTSFIASHPGGSEILRACGQDATMLFRTRHTDEGEQVGTGTPHSSSAEAQLESLKIGELAD